MKPSVIPAPGTLKKPRVLSARRFALLATTIASLGAALAVAPGLNLFAGYPAALAQNLSEQAHKLQAPVGFADIVEKVKPLASEAMTFLRDCASSSAALACPISRMVRKACRAAAVTT